MLLASLLAVLSQSATRWPLLNCTAPDVDAPPSEVNVLFLSAQSSAGFSDRASCDSLAGNAWNGSKCWRPAIYQALPVFAYLAACDFNERNGRIVPAFANLTCDKQIALTLADSKEEGTGVVEAVLDELTWQQLSEPPQGGPALNGVVGPSYSSQSAEIAPLTSALDILQLSYQSTSPALDNKRDYSRFGRTITSDTAVAAAIVKLWVELNLKYAAVIYVDDAYGASFNQAVLQAVEDHNSKISCSSIVDCLDLKSFPFQNDIYDSQIPRALSSFTQWKPTNNTGCELGQGVNPASRQDYGCGSVNNILFLGVNEQVKTFYDSAIEQRVLVENVPALVLLGDKISLSYVEALTGDARRAANGAARVLAVGATDDNPRWERFVAEWPSTPSSVRDAINELLPPEWQLAADFFDDSALLDTGEARDAAAYAYDAIVALGLLACEVAPSGPLPTDFGTLGWQNMTNVPDGLKFDGITGTVEFNEFGSRDKSTANFELQNELLDAGGKFEQEPLARYDFESDNFTWQGESQLFSFGQTGPVQNPQPLPTPIEDKGWHEPLAEHRKPHLASEARSHSRGARGGF